MSEIDESSPVEENDDDDWFRNRINHLTALLKMALREPHLDPDVRAAIQEGLDDDA